MHATYYMHEYINKSILRNAYSHVQMSAIMCFEHVPFWMPTIFHSTWFCTRFGIYWKLV